MSRHKQHVRRGLTLIELLIVLMIVLMLAAAAIPMMSSGTQGRRTREGARLV